MFFTLSFCICAICATVCFCSGFLFCQRVLYLHKTEKIDPINTFKTQKKVSALSAAIREERVNKLLEMG